MKIQYIYIGLILIIFLNVILFIYNFKRRKTAVSKPEKDEKVNNISVDISDQYSKTEVLDDCFKKENSKCNLGTNNNISLPKVPNLNEDDETKLLSSVENNTQNNLAETEILSTSKDEEKKYAVITYKQDDNEKEFTMTDNIICIGRDPDTCDILIADDRFIGREHALVYYKNNKIYIVDINSKNGTYINGERLLGQKQISGNTKVKLGKTELEIKVGE